MKFPIKLYNWYLIYLPIKDRSKKWVRFYINNKHDIEEWVSIYLNPSETDKLDAFYKSKAKILLETRLKINEIK